MEKLNFTEFTNELKKLLEERAGSDTTIDVHDTIKNNGVTYKAVTYLKDNSNISPNLRIEDFYEAYLRGTFIEEIVDEMIEIFERNLGQNINIDGFMDFEQAKEHIMIKLISYQNNKERLKKIPHIPFLDLAITYYYYLEKGVLQNGNGSIQIENGHLDMWKVDEKVLHQIATQNTYQNLPFKFETICDILIKMLSDRGLDAEEIGQKMSHMKDDIGMYVLSNKCNYFGAAALYYPGVLKEIAKQFDADLIILPSSIHEVIILPVNGDEKYDELNAMIREINTDQVAEEEILSDHLYYYNLKTEKLEIPSVSL